MTSIQKHFADQNNSYQLFRGGGVRSMQRELNEKGMERKNPYGDVSNIGALKAGLATNGSSGLERALDQEHCDSRSFADSCALSPQAMMISLSRQMMMQRVSMAMAAVMTGMGMGMGMGPSDGNCRTGALFGGPAMAPSFGQPINFSYSYGSFSSFWGSGY